MNIDDLEQMVNRLADELKTLRTLIELEEGEKDEN